MTGRSNALRLPVTAPRGVVYLTGLQWSLWWILTRPRRSWTHGDLTLTKLSDLTGSSRGRCWHALTRLRSLELVSWRAWPVMPLEPDRRPRRFSPGCRGRLLVWIPPGAREARRAALRARGLGGIDSVSGAFSAYASARGAAERWTDRQAGRGTVSRPSLQRAGARSRRGPPRVVYGRCPAGHSVALGRRSWLEGPEWAPSVAATFVGRCRRCAADVSDGFELELPPPPGRGPSGAELADPTLLEARRRVAAELVADPRTSPKLRERIRRDYLEPPASPAPWRPAAAALAGDVLAATFRRNVATSDAEASVPPDTLDRAGRRRGGEGTVPNPSGDSEGGPGAGGVNDDGRGPAAKR